MWDDEELTGAEILGHHTLGPAGGKGLPGPAGWRGGVRCGHPLIYPVPAEDLPVTLRGRAALGHHRYAGALFAFDLDALEPGRRYTAARFDVTLADGGSRAVRLDLDGDEFGLVTGSPASGVAALATAAAGERGGLLRRLLGRRGVPRAWANGVQTGSFGWSWEDPRGRFVLPRTYGMHALLEIPAGAPEVAGLLSVQVETTGPGGRETAVLSDAVPFTEPLTPAAGPDGASVRLCMAADVVGYSRRGNAETELLQHDLVEVLGRARQAAGIAERQVDPQPQGDGQFTVLPYGIDESRVIPALLRELGERLAERDRGRPADETMRLRVALHRGLVKQGENGWVGTSAIAVHRLLDSAPLREAIKTNPSAVYALGVPDVLYRDVIVHAVQPPVAADFRAMTVELPEKGFLERGWIHVGPEVTA
ncbi:hypothetical protein Aca07nite_57930 [Actinoplanes capillaceus]|uniref:Uncharacterized protein n=1 Tax=Actinoplanes campanulatus TaxID=113559 RepID=A0ABQ3WQN0_9ACTN|nr:hypothetical protein [Actinoplanes capillaceus]GID48518.1 hypothetical protein Aca07nite_57930 [Actinoplanes capillaceus]